MPVTIRRMTDNDVPAVLALINYDYIQFFDDQKPLDEHRLRQWVAAKNNQYRMFVAEQEDKIVGYISFTEEKNAYLAMLQVHPNFRRKGIGRSELRFAAEYLKKSGAKEIHLEIRTDNPSCIKLAESEGFRRTGVREKIMADGCSTYIYSKNAQESD